MVNIYLLKKIEQALKEVTDFCKRHDHIRYWYNKEQTEVTLVIQNFLN